MPFLMVLLWLVVAQPVAAQLQGLTSPKPSAAPEQAQAADPLGRSTPKGTILGFSQAMRREDVVAAARFMQLTASQRDDADALAGDLKSLMDRYLIEPLTAISDSPNGALDDGLPMDRERVGPLAMGDEKADIILVRVTDPQSGPIWLISSETLDQVPALSGSVAQTWIERAMPASLVGRKLFGVSVAHWLVLVASLAIPFILLTLIFGAVNALVRRMVDDPVRQRELDTWYAGLRWPAIAVLALAIQLSSMPFLGFPLTFRSTYSRVGLILLAIAVAWLVRRVLTFGFARARSMVWGSDSTSTRSLMLLGERLLKALVILVAVFAILTLAGVDTKTALAGVGIGGLALALGAQRTVENLLGGVFLLTDRALAVGDMVRISNRLGWVEDITLRSVRLRTLEQTLMSVPAGVLAQTEIENFSSRQKILVQTTLRLRFGTSMQQLQDILGSVRKLLDEHPMVEAATSRIRLIGFGDRAIEVELFAYVLTSANPEFLAVREALLLKIGEIVEASGTGFAQPTQFVYLDGERGGDAAVRAAAAREPSARDDGRFVPSIIPCPADDKASAERAGERSTTMR